MRNLETNKTRRPRHPQSQSRSLFKINGFYLPPGRKPGLLEVRPVLLGKISLVGGQLGFGEDGVLGADAGAVSAIDAFIGIDEDLGNRAGGLIRGLRRDGRGSALGNTSEILNACIGYNV